MLVLKEKQKPQKPPRKPRGWFGRLFRFAFFVFAVIASLALVEHVRGRWALKTWARELTINNRSATIETFWPAPSPKGIEFSNQLDQVLRKLSPELKKFAGQISEFVTDNRGKWYRGSQQPAPVMSYGSNVKGTWSDLNIAVEQNQPTLQRLKQLMKDPPAAPLCVLSDPESIPNFVSSRVGAQVLQAAAMRDLRHSDIAGFLETIKAIDGFVRVYADDPCLVNFMVHIAISSIRNDLCWDALQANGWSDQQLQTLQQLCEFDRGLLNRVADVFEAERVHTIQRINLFRSHSYEDWVAKHEGIFKSFGISDSDIATAVAPRQFRQWVFHPVWSFCWADQEAVNYLKATRPDSEVITVAADRKSWRELDAGLNTNHSRYLPPQASWRFYRELPFDSMPNSGPPLKRDGFPHALFENAWSVAFLNLTVNEMVLAVTAMKRYELRHSKSPRLLADLVPEFLSERPRDLMDGQPLRYQCRADGSFLLYSVGSDAHDDGGDSSQTGNPSPWWGRDCVWPLDPPLP